MHSPSSCSMRNVQYGTFRTILDFAVVVVVAAASCEHMWAQPQPCAGLPPGGQLVLSVETLRLEKVWALLSLRGSLISCDGAYDFFVGTNGFVSVGVFSIHVYDVSLVLNFVGTGMCGFGLLLHLRVAGASMETWKQAFYAVVVSSQRRQIKSISWRYSSMW